MIKVFLLRVRDKVNPHLDEGTLIIYDFVRKNYYEGFIERFNKFLKEVQEGKYRLDE